MPINKSDIIFIGNAGGICGYLSHGLNIIRKSSSLTTKRVAEEPEFEGFRNSGNRMKQASPIAASLYNLLSKEQKLYALYRLLTGEVLKMLKQGVNTELIAVRLKKQYIDPILERQLIPENQSQLDHSYTIESKNIRSSCLLGKDLFKVLPYRRGDKRHLQTRRVPQYAIDSANQQNYVAKHNSDDFTEQRYLTGNDSNHQTASIREPESISKFSGLTYLGRLPECKGLSMWLRPLH
jgi:hypothetical protein